MPIIYDQPRLLFQAFKNNMLTNAKRQEVEVQPANEEQRTTMVTLPFDSFIQSGAIDGTPTPHNLRFFPGSAVDNSFLTDDTIYFSLEKSEEAQYRVSEVTNHNNQTGVSTGVEYRLWSKKGYSWDPIASLKSRAPN